MKPTFQDRSVNTLIFIQLRKPISDQHFVHPCRQQSILRYTTKVALKLLARVNAHCNQDPGVQLIYGLCNANYGGSLICHHLQHRIISAQHDTVNSGQLLQQRKPRKQQGGGLCTCNHPMRLASLARNVQPFLPPESHQCYATPTPASIAAARVRHLK